jgi:DNA-binding transcriptional regulator YiaG
MSTGRHRSHTAPAESPLPRKTSSTAVAVDSAAALQGSEVELGSRSVQPGAKGASGTDSTGPDAAADRDSLRCPCRAQGATECTNLHAISTPAESLWSIDQVATYLNVPVQTLRTWRKHQTGPPAARIGRHLRYDPAHVRSWIARRSAEATDD